MARMAFSCFSTAVKKRERKIIRFFGIDKLYRKVLALILGYGCEPKSANKTAT